MGRRSFSGTARHCTADDDKGGAGFFRCRRRRSVFCIQGSPRCRRRDATAAHHPTRTIDRSACTSASRHSAPREAACGQHQARVRAAFRRPALNEPMEIRFHNGPHPADPARTVPSEIQTSRQCSTTGPSTGRWCTINNCQYIIWLYFPFLTNTFPFPTLRHATDATCPARTDCGMPR